MAPLTVAYSSDGAAHNENSKDGDSKNGATVEPLTIEPLDASNKGGIPTMAH